MRLLRAQGYLALLLSVLAAAAQAQAPTDYARLSLGPSQVGGGGGLGFVGETFTFTAEDPRARCLVLDFDDGREPVRTSAEGGRAVLSRSFSRAKTYRVTLTAYHQRECDDPDLLLESSPVQLPLNVVVKPRPILEPAPSPTRAQFLVTQSNPDDALSWNWYTFTGDVSGARSYDIDFGDGSVLSGLRPVGPGGSVRQRHQYARQGSYAAVLTASRANGETVELRQAVRVTRPAAPPVVAQVGAAQPRKWPPQVSSARQSAAAAQTDPLFWLLLLAGAVAALRTANVGSSVPDTLRFIPVKDRGSSTIMAPPGNRQLIATRLWWRKPARFRLSDDARIEEH